MNIDNWFPVSILTTNLVKSKHLLPDFVRKAYEIRDQNKALQTNWRCDTYNSLNTYDLFADPLFESVINESCGVVFEFSKHFGCTPEKIRCTDAWINIAPPGEYQEYHIHDYSHFSVVVYLKTAPNCGNIVFKSHASAVDMFRLPAKEDRPSNHETCSYVPEDTKVVCFRSNLLHMVEKNKSCQDRISLAMNFLV